MDTFHSAALVIFMPTVSKAIWLWDKSLSAVSFSPPEPSVFSMLVILKSLIIQLQNFFFLLLAANSFSSGNDIVLE